MTLALDKAKTDTEVEVDSVDTDVAEDEKPLTQDDIVASTLKELGMTKQDAYDVVEAIFTRGEYREVVPVRKDLSVTLRTRTAREEMRLKEELIRAGDMAVWERNYLVQVHNLATSLVSLGETVVTDAATDVAYKERREFVLNLPAMLMDVLIRNLATFDMKVMVSCQDPLLRDF